MRVAGFLHDLDDVLEFLFGDRYKAIVQFAVWCGNPHQIEDIYCGLKWQRQFIQKLRDRARVCSSPSV